MGPQQYVDWVLKEIRHRHSLLPDSNIHTLYFGGGTPSLLDPDLIVAICQELANVGFTFTPDCEFTLEINPATLNENSMETYMRAGFNRFSVGAQTFDDDLLKACGRRHNAADTRNTLRLLQKYDLNYSFDLLFALPGQSRDGLRADLDEVAAFAPPHLSAYCLTVPQGHPMSLGRPPEDEQVEMFSDIESRLQEVGLAKYEISNFARPGRESRHNLSYWNDTPYWGIGLSSHSYLPAEGAYGRRFWNPKSLREYGEQVEQSGARCFTEVLPVDQFESLEAHESLTDFCHMFLRTQTGLLEEALRRKFGEASFHSVKNRLDKLIKQGLLVRSLDRIQLTTRGQLISNKVFEELTFLKEDLSVQPLTDKVLNTYCSV